MMHNFTDFYALSYPYLQSQICLLPLCLFSITARAVSPPVLVEFCRTFYYVVLIFSHFVTLVRNFVQPEFNKHSLFCTAAVR